MVFSDRTMYMQLVTGRFTEVFSKNTVYRFLSAAKTNWERFVLLLSERIINRTIRPLTGKWKSKSAKPDSVKATR